MIDSNRSGRSDGTAERQIFKQSAFCLVFHRMAGRDVFRFAVGAITDVVDDIFRDTGYGADDIDWLVPHQANKRIIDGAVHKLGIAPEKVITTVAKHGNTSAASIPLALASAVEEGRIKSGDLVMMEAMGGGFTWGAVLVRW